MARMAVRCLSVAGLLLAASCLTEDLHPNADAWDVADLPGRPPECEGLVMCTYAQAQCWWGVECCYFDTGSRQWRHVTPADGCLFDIPVEYPDVGGKDLALPDDVLSQDLADSSDGFDVPAEAGPDAPDVTDVAQDVADIPADGFPDVPADGFADVPVLPERLELDPATLTFFLLPIDSLRGAVSGYDAAARTCATVIFDYSNTGHALGASCDDFGASFPYVIVVPDTDGPCGQWEYGGGPQATAMTGCVDFKEFAGAGFDLADFEVTVANPGGGSTVIQARNRDRYVPPPVNLGLRYVSDIPEDVYIQTGDDYGLPAWAQVLGGDGQPRLLFDRCDVPSCDHPGSGVCGIAFHQVQNVTGGTYAGQAWLTWDGRFRTMDATNECWKAEPAPDGDYTLRVCFGWATMDSATGAGPDVKDPQCHDVTFTIPGTTQVAFHADFGG